MKQIKILSTLCLTVVLIFTSCAGIGRKPVNSSGENILEVDAKELKDTVVTPQLEEKITQGKNLLYCSSFQLAWNELTDNIIKDKLKLQGNPGLAQELNRRLVDKKSLSEESYIAMSGFGRDNIVEKINEALKKKFGDNAWKVENKLEPEDILVYAFMYKNLEFGREFERISQPLNFNGAKVSAFGIESSHDKTEDIRKLVEVLYFKNEKDFIISLKSKSAKDEIILAKVEQGENLLNSYEAIQNKIKKAEGKGQGFNKLVIPKFNFDISRSFEELKGKGVLNKGFEGYFVTEAAQRTRFKLDEKGVVLKSEGKIALQKSAVPVAGNLIFDSPFMLILKEKSSDKPYFMMWVDNSELMVK